MCVCVCVYDYAHKISVSLDFMGSVQFILLYLDSCTALSHSLFFYIYKCIYLFVCFCVCMYMCMCTSVFSVCECHLYSRVNT